MTQKIENIIVKYLTNQASGSELEELEQWLKIEANVLLFKEYIKINHLTNYNMMQFDAEKIKKQLLEMINKEKKVLKMRSYKRAFKYAAAAVVVGILATAYFLRDTIFNNQLESTTPIIVNNQIEPGIDKATLTLETGETITLAKGTVYQNNNVTTKEDQLIYKENNSTNELVYNYLTVPRGGQFAINLADGTKVWLNSETQLKYPVSFTDGESRQVELVYGEAYFEVTHSTEHKGSHFKVVSPSLRGSMTKQSPNNQQPLSSRAQSRDNNQIIEVLGTKFNVKAYKEDTTISTTLVEGSVAVTAEGASTILKPGEQSKFDTNTKTIQVDQADVFRAIAWKEGIFSFKNKTLKEIMATLSRWYDMDVVFENKELEKVNFNGTLYKNQSIEEILGFLQSTVNTYEINNKTIILK